MSLGFGETIKIPSPIDVHVHLREPGGEDKETIESGTAAAHAGGYQAVFDMPNNPGKPTWSEERLDEKIAIARKSARTDIGFYAGVDLTNPALKEFPAMVQKAAGLKLYMDHTTGNTQKHDLESVRQVIDEWIRVARESGNIVPILLHAREEIGGETAEYIASQRYPIHWCHISTQTEAIRAEYLTELYPEFYSGGVTPHHLTMTDRNADFQQGWNGARMQPPLGSEQDADRLLHAYNRGSIQILETDHAPHTSTDKRRAEIENPTGDTDSDCVTCFGVSGIEFVLPVMTSLVRRKLTTMERVVDSLYDQPIKMLGQQNLRRLLGSSALNKQTSLRIEPYIIGESDVIGMSRNTPYIGWTAGAIVQGVE
jgi:dihydroorotase